MTADNTAATAETAETAATPVAATGNPFKGQTLIRNYRNHEECAIDIAQMAAQGWRVLQKMEYRPAPEKAARNALAVFTLGASLLVPWPTKITVTYIHD